jgi:hypothetical protein
MNTVISAESVMKNDHVTEGYFIISFKKKKKRERERERDFKFDPF